MRRNIFIMVGAACLISSSISSAQDQQVLDRIAEPNAQHPTLSKEEAADSVMATATAMTKAMNTCLPTAVEIEEPTSITGVRVILQGVLSGEIRNGWTVYANYEGCADTRSNVLPS